MRVSLEQVKQWYYGPLPETDMDYFCIMVAIDKKIKVLNLCKVVYTVTAKWNEKIREAKIAEWTRRSNIFKQYLIAQLGLNSKRSKKYLEWFERCFDKYKEDQKGYSQRITDVGQYFSPV